MTLRQPTFGHGGNARFDEEVEMATFFERVPPDNWDHAAHQVSASTNASEADRA
jgi:hypothetical protein